MNNDLHSAADAPDAPVPATSATAELAATGAPGTEATAATSGLSADLVKLALRRVKDPELNLNIVDLGLIYDIRVEGSDVDVDMSLTSPGCPSGPEIMKDAEDQLKSMDGIGNVTMHLVWTPMWTPDRIEPRVRAYLGF